jgi:TPR repeat protein
MPPPAPSAAERTRAAAAYAEAQRIIRRPGASEQELSRAAELILEAARLGHPEAQTLLAGSHLFRSDGGRDPAAALPWLTRAAFQGQVEAQVQLARLVLDGDGTRREPAWAALWFRRAAERGSAQAQFALALQQIAGIGTPANDAEALARLTIASDGGVAEARRYRDALRARVPAGDAAAALARVRGQRAAGPVAAIDRPLVVFAQYALTQLGGQPGAIDGIDGPTTRAALAAFARQQALAPASPYAAQVIDRLRERLPAGP